MQLASPAQALSEEQRQQIILKLLEERRNKSNKASEVQSPLQQQDRTARVQELLRQRAAAKKHQGADYNSEQQHHQQQSSLHGIAGSQPRQLQQHLQQQASLDDLLSPGSTCSLASNRPNTFAAHHRQQELQQQPHSEHRLQHLSNAGASDPVSLTKRSDVDFPYSKQHTDHAHLQHAQQQPRQHQQQHQQQLQANQPDSMHTHPQQEQPLGLAAVIGGPVDVSQLWAADETDASLSEHPSYTTYGSDVNDEQQYDMEPTSPGSSLGAAFGWHEHQQQQHDFVQQQWQQHRQRWHSQQHDQQQQQQHMRRPVPPAKQREQQHIQRRQQQLQQQRQRQQQQLQQQQQQQLHRQPSPARQSTVLPHNYPASAEERLQQLAQPKALNREKYERIKQTEEQELLQACSFRPRTGRGPQHSTSHQGLPVSERLYHTAAERQARLARKAAEAEATQTKGCTFRPKTNAAAQERYLASYEYVPIHERLGDVLRSKNEKLAALQMRVEKECSDAAPFTPRINPRSSVLALRASQNSGVGSKGDDQQLRSSSTGRSLRKCRSETDLSQRQQECTFTPRINSSSKALLQASGDIPRNFLQRQEYFDRLAKEKRQLLALAVEDQHCCFSPTRSMSDYAGRSSGSLDGASFLDRIERLAYQDKRAQEATRTALAEQIHNTECTFKPAINPRSQRMAKATPIHELYENTKGKLRRGAVALAVEMQQKQECTFAPNLQKPGVRQAAPPESQRSLSATEMDAVVERLHNHQRFKEDKVEAALSFKQYQELKQCTFTPEITREVPKQQGPVLVRGLGRFMELKEMARKQQEQKAAVEAKVFLTQLKPVRNRITMPEPFNLGRGTADAHAQLRRNQAEALALEAATRECTFKPQISSHHQSRQQRVQQLLQSSNKSKE